MTVNDLRGTLTRLTGLLEAAGAKATATHDLTEFVELTAPFGDLTLRAFAALAEAGRAPRGEGAGTGRQRPASKGKADPGVIEAEVRDLYSRAGETAVTLEQVNAACGRLGALSKDALLRVAGAIELSVPKSVKKEALVGAITERVVDRKETAIRRTLLDRPTSPNTQPPDESTRTAGEPHAIHGG